jgi:hypothetical protein
MKTSGESRVHDVVEQHPATGEISIQKGGLFRNERGELYAVSDPDRSVAAYAGGPSPPNGLIGRRCRIGGG